MTNTNDNKIMMLKKQIEEKKVKLSKTQKFSPITNCSLELDGVRFNIQVLTKDQLVHLLTKLFSYAEAATKLGIIDQYNISGYHVSEWIGDLESRLEFMGRKDEEQKLKQMETTLDRLLSEDKKVELQLSEIEALLKEEV